jgi:hypothetical protein
MIFKRMFVEHPKDILMSFEIYFYEDIKSREKTDF